MLDKKKEELYALNDGERVIDDKTYDDYMKVYDELRSKDILTEDERILKQDLADALNTKNTIDAYNELYKQHHDI